MPDGPVIDATIHERFFQRLPADVADGLTAEQRTAISAALAAEPKTAPWVSIRFAMPAPVGRWFMNVFLGRERRSRDRLKRDRAARPLTSFGNVLLIAAGIAVFSVLSVIALLLYLPLLEF